MIIYVNTITGGLVAIVILLVTLFVSLLTILLGGTTTSKAFIASFAITFILSALFWGAGLVAGKYMGILLALLVLSFVWYFIEQRAY